MYEKVKNELNKLPANPEMKNFETYLISKVGPTLYKNFFKNFTEKFWKINPKNLSSEWALVRKLGSSIYNKKMFFNDKWCSYPKKTGMNYLQIVLKIKKYYTI